MLKCNLKSIYPVSLIRKGLWFHRREKQGPVQLLRSFLGNPSREAFSPIGKGNLHIKLFVFSAQSLIFWSLLFCSMTEGQKQPGNSGTPPKKSTAPTTISLSAAEFDDLKSKAEAAREIEMIPESIALYTRLVTARPNWAEGWWFLGSLQYHEKQYLPAAKSFQKYVEFDPNNGKAKALLGLSYYYGGQYKSAFRPLAQASTVGVGNNKELAFTLSYCFGDLLVWDEQYERAISTLQILSEQNLESEELLELLGAANLRIPKARHLLKEEEKKIARPFGKALFLQQQARLDESLALYEKLVEQYRSRPNVAYAMGNALLFQKNPERAVLYFQQELERDPRHIPAMTSLLNERIIEGKFEEALNYANRILSLDPKDFFATYSLGRIYLYQDKFTEAIATLEKTVRMRPTAPSPYYSLAQSYQRANRPEDAAKARAEFTRLGGNRRSDGSIIMPPVDPKP
jgi:tetratricopeptide (TPR) repeat protein